MLSCDNVTCIRGDKRLFANLGFCLAEGALLLLKGPNGSGKTSLLKVLAGLLAPDAGQVLWDNAPIINNEAFQRDLMMIGHKSAVKLESTVHENLTFWGKLYGTEVLVPAALSFYDLDMFSDTRAGELSAGWQ
ncbi:MAG: ATP-binding cassette domain-containing protein, partial [Pseudomonadota bacterium]|nr:ATP-binding cassette domain-containing protein [Pseudomonadota bacterium]